MPQPRGTAYRLGLIQKMMGKAKVVGNPRDYVILSKWELITDVDRSFTLAITQPDQLAVGSRVYVTGRSTHAALIEVVVKEDQGEQVMVEYPDGRSKWVVPREDVKMLPVPLWPVLVAKNELWKWIGHEAARRFWHYGRRVAPPPVRTTH